MTSLKLGPVPINMTFLQLLHRPEYVWATEEIKRFLTGPTGHNTGLDQIDSVNDLIGYQMLACHHQVAADINHYINTNEITSLSKRINQ